MYYTGLDPQTMKPVYVPRSPHEKAMQRALIQYRDPKLYDLVVEALKKAGRTDLIGYGPKCLVRPRNSGRHTDSATRSRSPGRAKNADTGKAQADRKRKKKTIRNIHKKK